MARLRNAAVALLAVAGPVFAGTYLPGEGNFDVSVFQTTGERPFREILTSPFTVHAYTNRAPIDVDAAEAILFRNPDGSCVLVAVCSEGRGLKDRKYAGPRPNLYVKCAGEYKHLPLPYGTWSVTTMVFRRKEVR